MVTIKELPDGLELSSKDWKSLEVEFNSLVAAKGEGDVYALIWNGGRRLAKVTRFGMMDGNYVNFFYKVTWQW